MKLNIALVLFALFAHSGCSNSEYFSMNLSPESLNSIRSILENQSGITEPETFIVNMNELGRTFSYVDEQGSVQLAEAFVRAYKDGELNYGKIQNLMKDAVRVGNINAYVYFSQKIIYLNFDILEIAAANGQLDIIEREFAIIEKGNYPHKNDYGRILCAAIRAGHLHVLKWFAGKGVFYSTDAKKFILEALEARSQEIIDFLLQAQIYVDYYNPDNRFNFRRCLLKDTALAPDSVCFEAARIGNMNVVRYYFDENLPICRSDLERAQIAAYKAGHTEIGDLIGNRIFFILQLFGKQGSLYYRDVKEALIAALEVKHQKVIDYLLYEQIYQHPLQPLHPLHPLNMETRLTYEDSMRIEEFIGHEAVFIKAAEVGNMDVFQYYFSRQFYTAENNLLEAQQIALKNGHNDIADSIRTFFMF